MAKRKQHPPTTSHNWMTKGAEFLKARKLPPKLHALAIIHDDWCDLINNRGFCNCDTTFLLKKLHDPEDN